MSARSLLFQPNSPLQSPPDCGPCRTEIKTTVYKDGRLYTFVVRDKIAPEDPYLVLVKAMAFAIQNNEPYMGRTPDRGLKDFLIKTNVVV